MRHQVEVGDKADAQLAGLDAAIGAGVERKIHWLAENAAGMVHRRLVGMPEDLAGLCKLRVGDYRILYWVYPSKKLIRIYRIQHRSEVYRQLRSRMKTRLQPLALLLLVPLAAHAQVNSGSNGSDGAFNPTTNTAINMADHPNGIYQYTSVNIPTNVTVTFIPNVNNTPVVWLVQSDVLVNGTVDVSGQPGSENPGAGGMGGPGGWRGGNGFPSGSAGQGPGGGTAGCFAADGRYDYGGIFLIPLLGGSGGGGSSCRSFGGGGGGGAILIAASGTITVAGKIAANGGPGDFWSGVASSGGGSGGAVRLVASRIVGTGSVDARPASSSYGRVRFDCFENDYSGSIGSDKFTQGFQPVIIPTSGQLPQLSVTSVGGVPVSASPTGALSTPDAVLSAQQNNPIPIVVHCSDLPLNTQITVSVKPANGAAVSATGLNNTGTFSSSTATVLLNMPRGGGLIYATAATGN